MTHPEASRLADADLVRAFESCRLAGFHHREHVRLVFTLLREQPPLAALARFSDGLKRFAAANGKPGLYHETITWAYLFLIHERRERGPHAPDFQAFAARNPDLLIWKPGILDSYYREQTLRSELARRVFVLPDRAAADADPLRAVPRAP